MSSGFTKLNPATVPGGDDMDVRDVTYVPPPVLRKREIVVLGGDNAGDFIQPIDANPAGTEYALPTRNMPQKAPTGAITNVPSANVDTQLLPANPARLGASVFNDSTEVLYLACASVVVTNILYSVKVLPGGYFEAPANYSGEIRGAWAAVNGAALVTEYT